MFRYITTYKGKSDETVVMMKGGKFRKTRITRRWFLPALYGTDDRMSIKSGAPGLWIADHRLSFYGFPVVFFIRRNLFGYEKEYRQRYCLLRFGLIQHLQSYRETYSSITLSDARRRTEDVRKIYMNQLIYNVDMSISREHDGVIIGNDIR